MNVGFRTRIGGETDFPCIYDSRVGLGRTYAAVDRALTYQDWLASMRNGRSYVSDGRSHLIDFAVQGARVGVNGSELKIGGAGAVNVTVRAAAYLDPIPNDEIRKRPPDQKPYWDIERARAGNSREVTVEIVVNGKVAGSKSVVADGQPRDLAFDVAIDRSSWIAARILPSSHTNPIFVIVGDKPIRASRRSAEWCLNAVNQCWTQKAAAIRPAEREAARAAYDHAREVYRRLIAETQAQ